MDRDIKLSMATLMIAALTNGADLTGALLLAPRIENESYWLALAAAIVGIVAVLALDERKLKNVGRGTS